MHSRKWRLVNRRSLNQIRDQLAHSCLEAPVSTCNAFQRRHYASTGPSGNAVKVSSEDEQPPRPKFFRRITPFPSPDEYNPDREAMLKHKGKVLEIASARGFVPLSNRWLRDMCACTRCRNNDTAQRQINVLKPGFNSDILDIRAIKDGTAFVITFGDNHETEISKEVILQRSGVSTGRSRRGLVPFKTWNAQIAAGPPAVGYKQLQKQGLGQLLQNIRMHGFCFVDGTPATPEATERLLSSIGPIRNTHYGGFYDFTADLSSKDTAYTSESLEPHTDNTYFTEPAGLQALHLLSHTDGSGGESSLVDGFYAAQTLFKDHPQYYTDLSLYGVWAHASGNDGISIQPADPVPVLSHDVMGCISQVRWNNADRAGINCGNRKLDAWYDAAAMFDSILNNPDNQYWFQLTPGRVLIFDNWRVLHGRAAFTGKRRMCGGYINRDDFISRFRMTNMSGEEIRASTVTG